MKQFFHTIWLALTIIALSCGQSNKDSLSDEEIIKSLEEFGVNYDSLKAIAEKYPKLDSLKPVFCECLVNDSITNQEKLSIIDQVMEGGVTVNSTCYYPEVIQYKSFGNHLQNFGAMLGNALLPGRPFSKKSSYKVEKYEYPPVMVFAQDTGMIRALHERGANLKQRSKNILSIQEFWIQHGNLEMLSFIRSLDPDFREARIFSGSEVVIDKMLEWGAQKDNISAHSIMKQSDYERLVVKYDLTFEEIDCFKFHRYIRANTFQRIHMGRTKLLLKRGANPKCLEDGRLVKDVMWKSFDMDEVPFKCDCDDEFQVKWMELFLENNVEWDQCDALGKSPFISAVRGGEVDRVKWMLKYKAKSDRQCTFINDTISPISEAQRLLKEYKETGDQEEQKKYEEIVQLLLQAP